MGNIYDFSDHPQPEEKPQAGVYDTMSIDFTNTRYDFSAFNENISQVPQTQQREMTISAVLWLFSPKKNYKHMVRPYVYDFNNGEAMQLLHGCFNGGRPMTDIHAIETVPQLLEAVKPASYGHVVNLSTLDDCWTFQLVTQSIGTTSLTNYMAKPVLQTMSLGYCTADPIGFNGAINPECILRFTHHSKHQVTMNQAMTGAGSHVPKQSHDIIPVEYRNVAMATGTPPIVQLTPQYLRPVDPVAMASYTYGMANAASVGHNLIQPTISPNGVNIVSSDYRYSPYHLSKITDTITEAGKSIGEGSIFGYDHNYRARSDDLPTAFFDIIAKKNLGAYNGVGSWDMRRLCDLCSIDFPNLEIRKMEIQSYRQYDVIPSEIESQRLVYLSWLSDAITQLCEMEGITEIAFNYDSAVGNLYAKEGRWQINEELFHTIFGANKDMVTRAFMNFKTSMENNLFFVIRHTLGEFNLSVHFNGFMATIVDLFLKDFASENTPGYYFEQPNQYGGLINPNLGNSDQYIKNCLGIQSLVTTMEL